LIREAPERWEELVEASAPVVDYFFEQVTKGLNLGEAKQKSEAVRQLVPVLSEIRDEVERTHYVQKLARLIRVDEDTVRRQLTVRTQRRQGRKASAPQGAAQRDPMVFGLEGYCLTALLRRPDFLDRISNLFDELSLPPLREDDFDQTENRLLYAAWSRMEEGQTWPEWVDTLPTELQRHLDFLLARGLDTKELSGRDAERDIERRVLELRLKSVIRINHSLKMLQTEALEQGDAKASEYSQTMVARTGDLLRLQRALSERTALAQRERERAS
jgi:DNA primase